MAREAVTTAEVHVNPIVRSTRDLITFYNEVIVEMRKVVWPDRAQLKDMTIKIIIFVLFIGAVIGVIDVVFQAILVRGIPSLFAGR
ncbi:MAG: preprotein translocase subunit SecE [Gemmatimonadota bacterium]|nr:preprotein translocase subunit SecE [Gemmatimonadota bacterium]